MRSGPFFVRFVALPCFLATVAACAGDRPLSGREQGALIGGAAGAGTGAVIGNQLGSAGTGAAVGGIAGAATGVLIGESAENYEDTVKSQEEVLRRQQEELDRQDREIEDLKRQQYHNDVIDPYKDSETR